MMLPALGILAILAATVAPSSPVATHVVDIVGLDYAYRIPAKIASGATSIRFRNDGKQSHELNISLLKPGVTVQQFMEVRNAGKVTRDLVEASVGVLFAEPGQSAPAALFTEFLPDRDYVVICIFRDQKGAPRHHEIGMYSLIQPVGPASAATIAVATDTIIGRDYAYTIPPVIAEGRHLLAFTNAGKQRHEINISRLKPGVTMSQVAAVGAKGGDVNALFDENLGVLHSEGGNTPAGRLEMNFVAGREYVVACAFKDDDNAPEHFKLGMIGSFKVVPAPRR